MIKITETAWFGCLIQLGDPEAISSEIVQEIKNKSSLPFELFKQYNLEPDTITQQQFEDLCNQLATIKIKKQ